MTKLDDCLWHQLPTSFDHVGTSDPRFFDRLWFAASDRKGEAALQFTMGVYQNMNVVDGGFVAIAGARQHNLRVSRQLRPDYAMTCEALRIEVIEPMQRIRLHIDGAGIKGQLDWTAILPPQEEPPHYRRLRGRVLEDYSRYDQIGACAGRLEIDGTKLPVENWWACRDHSWGVRERVGVPEPVTGVADAAPQGGLFAFLFYSTETHGGHVQVAQPAGAPRYLSAAILDRAGGAEIIGRSAAIEADFTDTARPRRMKRVAFDVETESGERIRLELDAQGPAVAMQGLGYGGYKDGLGLGIWRGIKHVETEIWDVAHPADVRYPDGKVDRPVHRIQPVAVTQRGPGDAVSRGTGSLTFIAEGPLDEIVRLA